MALNQWFRRHQKKFYVVLGVIIMVTWYMASSLQTLLENLSGKKDVMFGKKVSPAEIEAVVRGLAAFRGGSAESPDSLRAQAWEHLMLLNEAQRLGIEAPDQEVKTFIQGTFARQSDGRFDPALYRMQLNRYDVTPTDYEKTVKERMAISRLEYMAAMSVKVSENEAWHRYAYDTERLWAKCVSIPSNKLMPLVSVTDDEMKKFHQERMNRLPEDDPVDSMGYLIPEKVKIEFVMAIYKDFNEDTILTMDQMRKYYDENKDRIFKAKPDATVEAAEAGKEATPQYITFDEARPRIETDLRDRMARDLATVEIERVNNAIAESMSGDFGSTTRKAIDFASLENEFRVEYQVTDFFSKEDVVSILPGAVSLEDAAFGQGVDAIRLPHSILDCFRGKYIFQLLDIKPPRASSFEEVRARVEQDLKLVKAHELAAEVARAEAKKERGTNPPGMEVIAGDVEARLKAMEARPGDQLKIADVTEIPERKYVSIVERGPFERRYAAGNVIAEAAFELAAGKVGAAVEKRMINPCYVVMVARREEADFSRFEADKDRIVNGMAQSKRQRQKRSWLQEVALRAKPSPTVLASLSTLPDWKQGAETPDVPAGMMVTEY